MTYLRSIRFLVIGLIFLATSICRAEDFDLVDWSFTRHLKSSKAPKPKLPKGKKAKKGKKSRVLYSSDVSFEDVHRSLKSTKAPKKNKKAKSNGKEKASRVLTEEDVHRSLKSTKAPKKNKKAKSNKN
jgi:hypothetical protein